MKTKTQKKAELENGKKLLSESQSLVFSDFSNIKTKDAHKLRKELTQLGAKLLVMKKRLLAILLKDSGVEFDVKQFKMPVATIFSKPDIEAASGPVFKFFSTLEVPEGKEKNMWVGHMLGGYNIPERAFVDQKQLILFGKLPTRDVMLAQTLGMIAAPIRSFLYILKQKVEQLAAAAPVEPASGPAEPTASKSAEVPAQETNPETN